MYIAMVVNDGQLGETKISNVFYKKPSLEEVYRSVGSPDILFKRYYRWRIIVSKIENFRKVCTISFIDYCDTCEKELNYVQSGDGYLYEEHQSLISCTCKLDTKMI